MMCQRIGRLPIRIIGFGMRCVSSPIRTPRPPQKITTFIAVCAFDYQPHSLRFSPK